MIWPIDKFLKSHKKKLVKKAVSFFTARLGVRNLPSGWDVFGPNFYRGVLAYKPRQVPKLLCGKAVRGGGSWFSCL